MNYQDIIYAKKISSVIMKKLDASLRKNIDDPAPYEIDYYKIVSKAFQNKTKDVFSSDGKIFDELFSKPLTDPPDELKGKVDVWFDQYCWENFVLQVQEKYGTQWADEIKSDLKSVIDEIYNAAQLVTNKKLKVSVGIDDYDKLTMSTLGNQNNFWLINAPSKILVPKINDLAYNLIKEGYQHPDSLAEQMKNNLSGVITRTDWYWRMLGSEVVNRARNFGTVTQLYKTGIDYYEFWAVMDEVTTEICRYMHLRQFQTVRGKELIDKTIDFGIPDNNAQIEQMKNIRPWGRFDKKKAEQGQNALYINKVNNSGGSYKSYLPDSKFVNNNGNWIPTGNQDDKAANAELEELAFCLPPLHGNCRSWIEATYDELIREETFYVSIPDDSEVSGYEMPKPEEPVPEEEPKVEIPPPDTKDVANAPFDLETAMTKVNMSVGGMHTKVMFKDYQNNTWMFKPSHGKDFQVWSEYVVNEFKKRIGMDAPVTYVTKYKDELGSVQKFKDNTGDLSCVPANTLSKKECIDVQKEHIIDWLFSNHDGHRGNLLRDKDGGIFGIDKGQAFKFFPKDKLDTEYNPNASQFGVYSFYNKGFFDKYAQGEKIEISDIAKTKELKTFIDNIEKYDDEAFKRLMKPYYESIKGFSKLSEQEFMEKILERKNNLKTDLTNFYNGIKEQRKANMPKKERKPRKPKEKPLEEGQVLTPINKELSKEIDKSGAWGKSIMVGGDTWENMNLLAYKVGDKTTILEGKIRAGQEERLMKILGNTALQLNPNIPKAENDTGMMEAEKIVASANATITAYNMGLIDVTEVKKELKDIYYHKIWQLKSTEMYKQLNHKDAMEIINFENHIGPIYEKVWGNKDYEDVEIKEYYLKEREKKFTPEEIKANIENLKVEKNDYFISNIFENNKAQEKGTKEYGRKCFSITQNDITGFYVANSHENYFSKQGKFYVKLPDNEPETIKRGMEFLNSLGLDSGLATNEDMEKLYLHKMAYSMKLDYNLKDFEEKKKEKQWDNEEQIKQLKHMIKYYKPNVSDYLDEYKVNEVSDLPWYKYMPEFHNGKGWAFWENSIDIDPKERKKIMNNCAIALDLTAKDERGRSIPKIDQLKTILSGGKESRMLSTEERRRVGITRDTMSQDADMGSGGANYTFTRLIDKGNERDHDIIFDTKILENPENVCYLTDNWGGVSNRQAVINDNQRTDLKRYRDRKYGDNETCTKNALPIDRYIKEIIVNTEFNKKELIDYLTKINVKEFNDIPISKLITVKY